jgi:aspartate racemase
MGLSMPSWKANDYVEIAKHFKNGVDQIAAAGADFFICPDNTGHIVLEKIINELPIAGLHIAEVVRHEIIGNGWKKVGLLGTTWTMKGPVYLNALSARNLKTIVPDENTMGAINDSIFDELCQGVFKQETVELFQNAIIELKAKGAECVILGCTEIPLIINATNSSLPILDSTRLLAKYAVKLAIENRSFPHNGWINLN